FAKLFHWRNKKSGKKDDGNDIEEMRFGMESLDESDDLSNQLKRMRMMKQLQLRESSDDTKAEGSIWNPMNWSNHLFGDDSNTKSLLANEKKKRQKKDPWS